MFYIIFENIIINTNKTRQGITACWRTFGARWSVIASKVKQIASFYRSGIGWGTDENSHCGVFPRVCDLSNPEFANGCDFASYCVGAEAYEKSKGGSVE